MNVRPAEPDDLDALARLWFDVWTASHAPMMPEALIKLRTLESFHERLAHMIKRHPRHRTTGRADRVLRDQGR